MTLDDQALFETLTDRQREVLNLLIEYRTSKEIGRVMGISHHTVDQHIQVAKFKLGVTSRSDLAKNYRRLASICQRATFGQTPIERTAIPLKDHPGIESENLLIFSDQGSVGKADARLDIGDKWYSPKVAWEYWGIITPYLALLAMALIVAESSPSDISALVKLLLLHMVPP